MFCGDATQTDLIKQNERNGISDFMKILRIMPSFDLIEFGVEDIVRSGLCKNKLLKRPSSDDASVNLHLNLKFKTLGDAIEHVAEVQLILEDFATAQGLPRSV